MLGQRLGVSPHISIRQLFQKLLVTLWRGNATLLLRRRHPGPLALTVITNSYIFVCVFFVVFCLFCLYPVLFVLVHVYLSLAVLFLLHVLSFLPNTSLD